MRLLISVMLVFALLGSASAQEETAAGDLATIIAKTADGYYIAYCGFDYFPDNESLDAFAVTYGWTVFGCGEPLNLELGWPLSNDEYNPLDQGTCGEGVDPAAAAALTNNSAYLRYGFSTKPCPDPAHPSGEFFSTELPGGGTAILRLPAGTAPHEVYTEWRGEQYPMARLEIVDAARLMLMGEADPDHTEGWLETAVAQVDCATVIALADGDQDRLAELLPEAAAVVNRCIEKYRERHGVYPATLAGLTTIPGAVIARLPYNPYHYDQQLGLEDMAEPLEHTVVYIPELSVAADGATVVTGYWLGVHGDGAVAAPARELPAGQAVLGQVIQWFEIHSESLTN